MPYLGVAPAPTGSVGTNDINDTAVTGAKLNADVISSQTELTSPASTDELLISDAGVLKRADISLIGEKNDIYWSAYGTTDQTSLTNNSINTVIYNNTWSQSSHNGYSTSTGKFTVPSGGKGIYHISGFATIGGTGTANNATRSLYNWIYKNGSTAIARAGNFLIDNSYEGTQGSNSPVTTLQLLDVGDTVEIKAQAYGNDFSIDNTSSLSFFGGYRVLAVA